MKTNCDSDEAETHLALIKESSKMLLERAVWLPCSYGKGDESTKSGKFRHPMILYYYIN